MAAINTLNRIAVIGECMLELNLPSHAAGVERLSAQVGYGGDTLNTALYLARLGVPVDYVTALGDDYLSQWLLNQWRAENIGCDLVARFSGYLPGLYAIETDVYGERRFHYWREQSAARQLLNEPASAEALFARLKAFPHIYLSGITLAIFSASSRARLFAFLRDFRSGGGKVIFDGNYRPKLWGSPGIALDVYRAVYQLTDVALPTLEDEQALFGDRDANGVIERLTALGVGEVVLKQGANGCEVIVGNIRERVQAKKVVPVDTTAAGDSFNAGYLSHRLNGGSATDAARRGHSLASLVIQHRGAIIPKNAMRDAIEPKTHNDSSGLHSQAPSTA